MSLKEAAGKYKLVEKTKTSRKINDSDSDPYCSHFDLSDMRFDDWIMRANSVRMEVAHKDDL